MNEKTGKLKPREVKKKFQKPSPKLWVGVRHQSKLLIVFKNNFAFVPKYFLPVNQIYMMIEPYRHISFLRFRINYPFILTQIT